MPSYLDPPRPVVVDIVRRALEEDVGPLGDLTASLIPPGATVRAALRSRGTGVLAGALCAVETCRQVDDSIALEWQAADGDPLRPGQTVAELAGPLASVLTAERTALNFLCHLSGVATLTQAFVEAAAAGGGHAQVWDTRKTLPGLRALEKAAVRAGGGVNHRGSLSDFVLVKDNHLAGLTIAEAVATARWRWPARAVEVECDRIDQVSEALAAGATMVLLDNMTPAQVAECVTLVAGRVIVEVSGGITLATIGAYSAAGADLISTSVITQSAPAFDLGLDLV
ncbi:MAG: nicotinate-nucleotide pyrophosphorylase (carboxylating) [Acidimicrobiia bacterium]|nr:nicotinate-nucleotide pyrophosphorylase (carboxylating) [Acidimicrobiia bacterium]